MRDNSRNSFGLFAFILGVFLLCMTLYADLIILNDGGIMSGEILQDDSNGVLIKMDYGTFTYSRSRIKDTRKVEASPVSAESANTNRIPNWGKIISRFAKCPWVHDLKQIPATVIDKGILKNVPYVSFQCASAGYEINIYGDLDNPAGVEIGVLNYLLKNNPAKSNCVDFIASVLPSEADKKIIRGLNWNKEIVKNEGMTFETTLPTEEDAYGGWWVSIYNESALEKANASAEELLTITQPRVVPKRQPTSVTTPSPVSSTDPQTHTWSGADFSSARPSISSSPQSSGGQVYVRAYTRKDGTYVRAHTRSAPSRR